MHHCSKKTPVAPLYPAAPPLSEIEEAKTEIERGSHTETKKEGEPPSTTTAVDHDNSTTTTSIVSHQRRQVNFLLLLLLQSPG
jgi:hypothetical protein